MNPAPQRLPHAFHLPVDGGHRFCLHHPAAATTAGRGRVLCLPPWAEELNAARATLARTARALAAEGFDVLQVDLFGCGDSDGEFAEASWAQWLRDARAALAWLEANTTASPLWLWGLRSGALLASELLRAGATPATNLLAWQPPMSGAALLQQFLRLHAAARWLGRDDSAEATPAQRLQRGEAVEIAGYTLSPELAAGLGAATWGPAGHAARLVWIDTAASSAGTPGPASARGLVRWQEAGWQADWQAVVCPPFWQTVEAHETHTLTQATLAALLARGKA